jgi:hypothetical protein
MGASVLETPSLAREAVRTFAWLTGWVAPGRAFRSQRIVDHLPRTRVPLQGGSRAKRIFSLPFKGEGRGGGLALCMAMGGRGEAARPAADEAPAREPVARARALRVGPSRAASRRLPARGDRRAPASPALRARHRPFASWRQHCPVCGADCTRPRCEHEVSFAADVPAEAVAEAALGFLRDGTPLLRTREAVSSAIHRDGE